MIVLRRALRFVVEHPWTTVIAVVLIGINVLGFERWRHKRKPDFALHQAAQAVRDHNSAMFQTWVDVDKLAGSFYDQHMLPERLKQRTTIDEAARKREIQAIARRLRRWVETSRIDESESPRLTLLGASLMSALTKGSSDLQPVSPGGTMTIAVVDLEDEAGRRMRLEVKLERQHGGSWRITEVTNVEEVFVTLRAEEQKRVNAVRETLGQTLRVTMPRFQKAEMTENGEKRTYLVTVLPLDATAAEITVVCHTSTTAGETSRNKILFKDQRPTDIPVTCICAAPCGPPMIVLDAVTRRNDGMVIRRIEALPLD